MLFLLYFGASELQGRIVSSQKAGNLAEISLKGLGYSLRKNINCQGKTFIVLPYLKRNSKYRRVVYGRGIWRKKAEISYPGLPEAFMKHLSQKAPIFLPEISACQTAFSLQAYLILLYFT